MRSDRPAQPAGLAGRWQPFAPGFTYAGAEPGPEPGTVSVIVLRQIDQGGGMTQRALDAFPMRKSARGYQILPRPVSHEAPASRTMGTSADDDAAALQLLLAYRPALRERIVALPPPREPKK